MNQKPNLDAAKKLTVTYRVEPGCLGPKGPDLVEDFCRFAQGKFETHDTEVILWNITPRFDKNLPELQHQINNKLLTRDQASRYLSMFEIDINKFEEHIEELLVEFIDEFMEH